MIPMSGSDRRRPVRIDLPVLAVYFVLAPVHQTLVLSDGSTVVRYLAAAAMAACVLQGWLERREFVIRWDLIWPVLFMAGWFALTILWARSLSAAVPKYIQFLSYFALMLVVGSRDWTEGEKRFVIRAVILACVFYSARLVLSAAAARRATISFTLNDDAFSADQNVLALHIGTGALFALHGSVTEKRGVLRVLCFAGFLVMLAGILSTGSRGGLAAFAAAAGWLGIRYSRNIARARQILPKAVGAAVLLAGVILGLNLWNNETIVSRYSELTLASLAGRLEIWGEYLELLFRRPLGFLAGYGIGCETLEHAAFLGRSWQRATHNDMLSLVCQAGIPGLLLAGVLVRKAWSRNARLRDCLGRACVFLALIGSMDINFFMTYGWWNALIFAFIGIGTAGPSGRSEAVGAC